VQTPERPSDPVYHDEEAARAYIEQVRWPDHVFCPHCGAVDKISKLGGPSMGPGWWYCGACQDKFTVRVGTVFERSHIPLHKWLLAFRLMASSKKGVSVHQLHRTLGITYKSAWFLAHHIREAVALEPGAPQLGGEGKVIEADETFIGRADRHAPEWIFVNGVGWVRKGGDEKMKVITLVERGGSARLIYVDRLTVAKVYEILVLNSRRESTLNTDKASYYARPGRRFAKHETVVHSAEEYVRGVTNTNTVEGYYSIFKRGMRGIYQHCGEKHLHRYLAEFDFRYSNRVRLGVDETERTRRAIRGAEGKRLTSRRTRGQTATEDMPF
jgi:transposase-like protein